MLLALGYVQLACWYAHKVREDADLGIRLARACHSCAILNTTNLEEATNTSLSWLQQKLRWIKGYVITYPVHMRPPKMRLHDLGFGSFRL